MSAVIGVENRMITEDRIARLESGVDELKGDVKVLSARLNESIVANAREFGSLRAEMEKGFGALRTEIEKNRTEMEKGLGALRTEAEKNRVEMERGFGTLRVEIEENRAEAEKGLGTLQAEVEKGFGSLRTSIESAKLWMLVTGVGSVILVTFTFLGRVLKLF